MRLTSAPRRDFRAGLQTTSIPNSRLEPWIILVTFLFSLYMANTYHLALFHFIHSDDDFAVSVLAGLLNKSEEELFFRQRSLQNPFTIFNSLTGFMEARNASGACAGPDNGWTEGDRWAYTFDVVHDTPGLIAHKGGNVTFVKFLDEHFDGHNDHTNEPSHHIPYLCSLAGAASKSQSRIRQIAASNYNTSVNGLSGNEDCGQMSAWYLFSALGFYPVNPVSESYVVGSPFFDEVEIQFPLSNATSLKIISEGAPSKPFVNSLTINGADIPSPIISHNQLLDGGRFEFMMSSQPQAWGSSTLCSKNNTYLTIERDKSAQYYITTPWALIAFQRVELSDSYQWQWKKGNHSAGEPHQSPVREAIAIKQIILKQSMESIVSSTHIIGSEVS